MGTEKKMTRAEYNSKCWEQRNKKSQLESYEKKNRELNNKIDRLRKTKELIVRQYEYYYSLKNREKSYIDESRRWKGSLFGAYSQYGEKVKTEDQNYYRGINTNIIDEINNEMTRLENQKYSDSVLGDLRRAINNLGNAIRNWANDI